MVTHQAPSFAAMMGRLGSGLRLVGRIGSGVRVSSSFPQKNSPGSVLRNQKGGNDLEGFDRGRV